jgi:glyoxylase-like metal-dependent hydrolase (beta-lactamase superfamily II)
VSEKTSKFLKKFVDKRKNPFYHIFIKIGQNSNKNHKTNIIKNLTVLYDVLGDKRILEKEGPMQITDHVYAKKINFQGVTPAGVMERTVHVYLVTGKETSCLIDTGVYPGFDSVVDFITGAGKKAGDISEILLTHSHVDHIGSLKSLKAYLGCPAAASEFSAGGIEDIGEQFRRRPAPNFYDFVQGSANVERKLKDKDCTRLGGSTLIAYAVPGHEKGHLAFFHQEDGVLFTGDSIPVPEDLPIYEYLSAEVNSLCRMRDLEGVRVLLMSSWEKPCTGPGEIRRLFDEALAYVRQMHGLTLEGIAQCGEADVEAVAKYVHTALRMPAGTFVQFFINTVQAHIQEKHCVF